MATVVIMPALGMAQETGKVLRWLKAEGETITKGEPLLEIETDKATLELEAPASGVLAQVHAAAGSVVPVGQVIGVIAAPAEEVSSRSASSSNARSPSASSPAASRAVLPSEHPAVPQVSPPVTRPQASPKARRLAQERGIDLAALSGSGPSGAIVTEDLQEVPSGEGRERSATIPTSAVWRVMAERTTQSWTSVPHFFLFRELNATALIAARDQGRSRVGAEVTYTDLLVQLVAKALREHPRLNARWDGTQVVLNPEINVSIAVAVESGLLVPVIRRADQLSLAAIVARRSEIVARAKQGTLRLDDVQGGTFTISNLGMYGVDAFTAVLNPPQAAILAVGRVADRVVAIDGRPAVQPMITMSLACDHRVADGARGAQFFATLAALVATLPVL